MDIFEEYGKIVFVESNTVDDGVEENINLTKKVSKIKVPIIDTKKCVYCNKFFSTKYNVVKHQKSHCKQKIEFERKETQNKYLEKIIKDFFDKHLSPHF
jgi:predicted RNase H-like nuclease (RuvC/YqgF family)